MYIKKIYLVAYPIVLLEAMNNNGKILTAIHPYCRHGRTVDSGNSYDVVITKKQVIHLLEKICTLQGLAWESIAHNCYPYNRYIVCIANSRFGVSYIPLLYRLSYE